MRDDDPRGDGGEPGSASGAPAETDAGADPRMLREVRRGLTGTPRELPPKYFYDRRGSELFERITRLPEYYPTRDEIRILEGPARERVRRLAPASLVELGAGSARKTRLLLEAMLAERERPLYVPVDVSASFLDETARSLRSEHPGLRVEPVVADLARPFRWDVRLDRPVLVAFLGGTLGNFEPPADRRLLCRVGALLEADDRFLLGVDLRPGPSKSRETVEAAYDDDAGVTAEFNRNVLRVLNRELGTDFDLEAFRHRAFYDDEHHRIEMHLEATEAQAVHLPDGTEVRFGRGESVRTEVSYKYDREALETLLGSAGMVVDAWMTGPGDRYALVLARPAESSASSSARPPRDGSGPSTA